MFQVPALPLSPFCPSRPGCPGIPGGPIVTNQKTINSDCSATFKTLVLLEDQALFLPGNPGKPLSPEKQV